MSNAQKTRAQLKLTEKPKLRAVGRPLLYGERVKRYEITLPPSIESKLRCFGKGQLSRAVVELVKKYL
jgi:hypothetical protein